MHRSDHNYRTAKRSLTHSLKSQLDAEKLQPGQDSLPAHRARIDLTRTLPTRNDVPAIVERRGDLLVVANAAASLVLLSHSAFEHKLAVFLAILPAPFEDIAGGSLGQRALAVVFVIFPLAFVGVAGGGISHGTSAVLLAFAEGAFVFVAGHSNEVAFAVVVATEHLTPVVFTSYMVDCVNSELLLCRCSFTLSRLIAGIAHYDIVAIHLPAVGSGVACINAKTAPTRWLGLYRRLRPLQIIRDRFSESFIDSGRRWVLGNSVVGWWDALLDILRHVPDLCWRCEHGRCNIVSHIESDMRDFHPIGPMGERIMARVMPLPLGVAWNVDSGVFVKALLARKTLHLALGVLIPLRGCPVRSNVDVVLVRFQVEVVGGEGKQGVGNSADLDPIIHFNLVCELLPFARLPLKLLPLELEGE